VSPWAFHRSNPLRKHASYVSRTSTPSDTRVDFVLRSLSDPDRHIDVALIVVPLMPESVEQ
jgi:hypothetical protein